MRKVVWGVLLVLLVACAQAPGPTTPAWQCGTAGAVAQEAPNLHLTKQVGGDYCLNTIRIGDECLAVTWNQTWRAEHVDLSLCLNPAAAIRWWEQNPASQGQNCAGITSPLFAGGEICNVPDIHFFRMESPPDCTVLTYCQGRWLSARQPAAWCGDCTAANAPVPCAEIVQWAQDICANAGEIH